MRKFSAFVPVSAELLADACVTFDRLVGYLLYLRLLQETFRERWLDRDAERERVETGTRAATWRDRAHHDSGCDCD